jgi:hypothetical protein
MQVKPFKPLGQRVKARKLKPTKKQAKENLIKKLFILNKNEGSN